MAPYPFEMPTTFRAQMDALCHEHTQQLLKSAMGQGEVTANDLATLQTAMMDCARESAKESYRLVRGNEMPGGEVDHAAKILLAKYQGEKQAEVDRRPGGADKTDTRYLDELRRRQPGNSSGSQGRLRAPTGSR